MADDEDRSKEAQGEESPEDDGESKSFRERVEEIRQRREEESDEDRRERMEEMMGGGPGGAPGGPGGMGGGGGNPFAQMMGGMMGGGPGGPGGMGQESSSDNEELVREVRQVRDELRDQTRALKRIADALEDR
ncbi:hypothetical protein [Haloarchaeobius sp. DT45]|uniref:hypothetical protein n=1 Tax=Haloarchaeobius sp. DT45 TaxID=3446116 RepID=UPI003F6C30F4